MRHQLCGAPLLLWLPAGCCAHPLGRGRPGQRLGAKIHCVDYGSPARPDADLMAALPRIDPKHQNYEKFKGVWNASLTALTIFMSAMSWFSELSVFGLIPEGSSLVGILVCGGCGVLFIFLGNYMPRIKQNYMFGCKTPWALNNEHNWNRTQRMGGIVFVVMGAALIVISLLATILGDAATMILLLAVVFGGSAWIYLYSYLVYIGKMK